MKRMFKSLLMILLLCCKTVYASHIDDTLLLWYVQAATTINHQNNIPFVVETSLSDGQRSIIASHHADNQQIASIKV